MGNTQEKEQETIESYEYVTFPAEFARYARRRLDEEGFTACETTCNEWNPEHTLRGTFRHAALVAGWMLKMQNEPVDSAMFYDARFGISDYGGLFDPIRDETYPAYDAFLAFNELYRRGKQLPYAIDLPGVYAVLAEGEDDRCLVLANTTQTPAPFRADGEILSCRMTGEGRRFEEIPLPGAVPPESILCVTIRPE